MMPLLKIHSVEMSFGTIPALRSVSFEVAANQHTAILGPSGSGKTTLLRIIAGLELPSSGRVWLGDQLVSWAEKTLVPPHQRGVAMLFQNLALWPNLTVMGNIVLGVSSAICSRAERYERALEAIVACELEGLEKRRPGSLSGGEQQRVALARAFVTRPRLLLLDEPFAGLDILLKASLTTYIRRLAERSRTTILLVSHDPFDAMQLCPSTIVLEYGRVEECGSFHDLLQNPKSRILQTFLRHARTMRLASEPQK